MGYAKVDANKVKKLAEECLKWVQKKKRDDFEVNEFRKSNSVESYLNSMNAKNPFLRCYLTGHFTKITSKDMYYSSCGDCERSSFTCVECTDHFFKQKVRRDREQRLRNLIGLCNASIEMGKEEVILEEELLHSVGY